MLTVNCVFHSSKVKEEAKNANSHESRPPRSSTLGPEGKQFIEIHMAEDFAREIFAR